MLDHNRLNGIFLTAVAFYLATGLVQLHAKQPSWQPVRGVSLHAIGDAIRTGVIEAVKIQGDENTSFAPGY